MKHNVYNDSYSQSLRQYSVGCIYYYTKTLAKSNLSNKFISNARLISENYPQSRKWSGKGKTSRGTAVCPDTTAYA